MKQLKIHAIMHVPFEGIGCIQSWIDQKQYQLSYTKIYEQVAFPKTSNFDFLIIMGGPMSVYEEKTFPWLSAEKEFIKQSITAGKKVLGICLGSQLIADVLGAEVYPNHQKEIGWLNIYKVANNHWLTEDMEDSFTVFHWHGDTYDLPENSQHLFKSEACKNQAFVYGKHVVGLQFHLETTSLAVSNMLQHGKEELVHSTSSTIQSEDGIRANTQHIVNSNQKMFVLLDKLTEE